MEPSQLLSPPAIIGEIVAGRASTVRRQLMLLSGDLTTTTFDLMDLLVEAKENGYPAQWGFASAADYGEKELGLKERKIQYLIRIGEVTKAVGLKRGDYEKVGTSKLRDITTLSPDGSFWNTETKESEDMAEHIVRLITSADEMTKDEVKEEVLRLQGRTGGDRPVVRSFSLTKDAWENVVKVAFERARMRLGSAGRTPEGMAKEYSDGTCLECICAEWLAGDVQETEEIPMEENNEPETA